MNKKKLKETLASSCIFKAHGKLALAVRIRNVILTIALWAGYIYLLLDFLHSCGMYHWLHGGTVKAYPKLRISRLWKITFLDAAYGVGVYCLGLT